MIKYKFPDTSKFPDCSALSESGRCTRLTVYNCQGEVCTFKRNRKEDLDSLKDVYKRLSSLEIEKQLKIAKKYYGGLMPWKKEESDLA